MAFGTVRQGEVLHARLEVVNDLRQPIHIDHVTPGCGCTAADYPRGPLPPGGTAEVQLSWRTAGRRGPNTQLVRVGYKTADEATKLLTAIMTATITPVVACEPAELRFGREGRQTAAAQLTADGKPARLTGAVANHPALTPTVAGGVLTVAFDPAVSGWDSGELSVTVATGSAEEPAVVPVRVGR